jgi:cation diffusion facilitator CzcD-associated flavoprotein CzcO
MCGGYYSYDKGYNPEFPGKDSFQGRILHPQNWDTSVDMKGKRVIVIGSGATAITLIPELVKMGAKHVTMVQRSPTFILDVPGQDWLVAFLRLTLPTKVATTVGRWGSIAIQVLMYKFCRLFPTLARWVINFNVKWHLGSQVDMKHFTPKYNPWDQRLCLCPDADFFKAVRSGSADIVTGPVDTFNESGLRVGGLANVQIDADVIVTATGMNLQSNFPMSSVKTTIDGKEYHPPNHMLYRTLMLSNIPNFAFSFGYINASWTLKADLISRYVCKLLNHMRSDNYKIVTPVVPKDVKALTALPLNSGYMNRSKGNLPSVGDRGPWVARHNFITDRYNMEYSNLEEGLVFKK